jgi:hypothetical protein
MRLSSLGLAALLVASLAACRQPRPEPEPPGTADAGGAPDTAPAPEPEPAETPPSAQPEPAADAGSDAASDAASEADAEPIPPKGFARFKMGTESEEAGPVDFRHRKHQKQFACRKCHHEIQKDEKPSACGDCHGVDEEICDLMTSFHKTCNPCHNSMGMGPVKCAECHKWIKKKKKKKTEEK